LAVSWIIGGWAAAILPHFDTFAAPKNNSQRAHHSAEVKQLIKFCFPISTWSPSSQAIYKLSHQK
jgi:hypothetical protein